MKTFVNALLALATIACMQYQGFAERPSKFSGSSVLVDTVIFSIPFTVNVHGDYSYAVSFGVHPNATSGIDPALGEVEYPPFPPCCAFTMFVTRGGNAILDLRKYTSPAQIDTYFVGISPESTSYPLTFSWPDLHPFYSGSVRLKSDAGGSLFNIDMKAQNSYVLTNGPFIPTSGPLPGSPTLWLYLTAEGPLPGHSLPMVTTFGVGGGGFQGIVNAPPGGTSAANSPMSITTGTTAWFEYGPTKSYGTSTTPQSITDGAHLNITEPYSLAPDTRVHFRAVAQNSLGTFYGGDRVASYGNPPPEVSSDTAKYRTAAYRDWADAKDGKGKRKPIKCKNNGVDFKVNFAIPRSTANAGIASRVLGMKFSIPLDTVAGWLGKSKQFVLCGGITPTDPKRQVWLVDMTSCRSPLDTGSIIQFDCHGSKGKMPTVIYAWFDDMTKAKSFGKGGLPKSPFRPIDDSLKNVILRYPMPNLHNVGENIYDMLQSPMKLSIGIATPPHIVLLPKYSDALKSLVKDSKGTSLYHTGSPHCLDFLDKNHMIIKKPLKGLPPDKQNNSLFAEQLTLKLNVAASDSDLFPNGLGELIYDNSGVTGFAGPFDGKTVRAIMDSVDRFLGCTGSVAGTTDPKEFLKVDSIINIAFAGPLDTISWSCGEVICTGVRPLSDVPYLHGNPSASPRSDFGRRPSKLFAYQPTKFRLEQNYPNPFNPTTTIEFTIPAASVVTMKVYNVLGQEVATILDHELMDEGGQEVEFDATNQPSGVYFYRVIAEPIANDDGLIGKLMISVKKMVLVK